MEPQLAKQRGFGLLLDSAVSRPARVPAFLGHIKPKDKHGKTNFLSTLLSCVCVTVSYQKLTWKSNTSFLKEAFAGWS